MENTLDDVGQIPPGDYSSFWLRTASFLIDTIILIVIKLCIIICLYYFFKKSIINRPIVISLSIFVSTFYYSVFESSMEKATPGKMLVGIKVTGLNGEQISFLNALGRYFAKYVSVLILFMGIF